MFVGNYYGFGCLSLVLLLMLYYCFLMGDVVMKIWSVVAKMRLVQDHL